MGMCPVKPQVEHTHYLSEKYENQGRFISYWHQVNNIHGLKPDRILEVGKGNGFLDRYLSQRQYDITTLDIDLLLQPTVQGSVTSIPFQDASFDMCTCFEVLEHLPYEKFTLALFEMKRVSRKNILLSLPDLSWVMTLRVRLPKLGVRKWILPIPRLISPVREFDGQHYWNIGTRGYPLRRIMKDITRVGLSIMETYRVHEIPWHRFFILNILD